MKILRFTLMILIIVLLISNISFAQENNAQANTTDSNRLNYNIDKLSYISLFNFIIPIAIIFSSIVLIIKNYKNFNMFLATSSLICTGIAFASHEFAIVYMDKTSHEITNAITVVLVCITIALFVREISADIHKLMALNITGFSLLSMIIVTVAFLTQFSIVQVASFTALGFIAVIIVIVIVVNTFVE